MTDADTRDVQIGLTTSVVIHALLLIIFAWVTGRDLAVRRLLSLSQPPAAPVKEEPQVTLLFPDQILPTPKLRPKLESKPYIRTTQNEPETAKPVKSDFISDRNTKAASPDAAFPDATQPLPSSNGIAIPTMELADRKYQDGKLADDNAGKPPEMKPAPPPEPRSQPKTDPPPPPAPPAPPTPKPAEQSAPSPMEQMDKAEAKIAPAKLPLEIRKPDDPVLPPIPAPKPQVQAPQEPLAMPSNLPTAKPQPKREMENFSPFTEQSKVKGTISNKGDAAVDAEATPMGKFMRAVTSAVEKKWHLLRQKNADAVSYGYLKVKFYVNSNGKPEDIQFVEKANNPRMEDFTLEAILKADIPPIPRDLLPLLDGERFLVEYDIIIHD